MKSRKVVLALTLGPYLVACQNGGSDSRCNATNCEALFNCAVTLSGDQVEQCVLAAAAAGVDAGVIHALVTQSCIDACNTNGNGAVVQCISQNFPGQSCQDINFDGGTSFIVIQATCNAGSDAGACTTSACTTCQTQCGTTFNTCTSACADAGGVFDAGACFPCAGGCSDQSTQCYSQCLAN